jgi:hypothetical protein
MANKDFDHLLRVWLPIEGEVEFMKKARAELPNFKALHSFSVHNVVWDWRFPEAPDPHFISRLSLSSRRWAPNMADSALPLAPMRLPSIWQQETQLVNEVWLLQGGY